MERSLNLALIGCGRITKSHLAALAQIPEVQPYVMVDIDLARAQAHKEEYGAKYAAADWRDAVAMDEVDIVDICTPHTLHRDPAVGAAEQGKHVFTEKPMATTLAHCDDMIRAADENRVKLSVGQVLRYRMANVRAREALKAGAIGTPMNHIRRRVSFSEHSESHVWSTDFALSGGWQLYGFGTHEMDIMLWLADSPAKRLWAQGRKIREHKDDMDDVNILWEFESGAMGLLMLSQNIGSGGWDQSIAGTEGWMHIATDKLTINGKVEDNLDYAGAMYRQWREFVDAIIEDREPANSGKTVRPCMAALEAARIAVETGDIVDVAAL